MRASFEPSFFGFFVEREAMLNLWIVYFLIYMSIIMSLSSWLSIYIYLCIHLSINQSIDLSIYLSIYLSIHLSIYFFIYLSVCLSICLSQYVWSSTALNNLRMFESVSFDVHLFSWRSCREARIKSRQCVRYLYECI